MTREDYEAQMRRLAEQRRVLVELAESAYQQQVRALDMVWRMLSGEGAGDLPPAPTPTPPASPVPQATVAATRPRRRLQPAELYNDIVKILPGLTDPFTHLEISRALGYAPDRASMHRTLLELTGDGHLAVQSRGSGNRPTRYRWPQRRVAASEP